MGTQMPPAARIFFSVNVESEEEEWQTEGVGKYVQGQQIDIAKNQEPTRVHISNTQGRTSILREELGLDNDGLLGEDTRAEDLEVTGLDDVDDGDLAISAVLGASESLG